MTIGRIPGATGIQPTIVDAKGDIIAATAADSVTRLAVGTNNTVLMADSAEATGLKWGASAQSVMTTKGDLLTEDASSVLTRLAVGANDTVLTADSSTATGLKWATAGGVAPLLIPINSGKYIKGFQIAALNQAGAGQNTTYYIPIYLAGTTYDRIGFKTGASQSTSATVRLGIYNVGANNKPTTLVLDAGTVSASAANTVYEITISQTLNAGYYYLALNSQSANQLYAMYISDPVFPVGGYADNMGNQYINSQMYYQTGVSGAFATAGTLVASNDHFFMGMRIA
jgi:hypothetical protein